MSRLFSELPRWYGFPKQFYIEDEIARENILELYRGRAPCFATPYKYTGRKNPVVNCIINDFDSKNLKVPYRDASRLITFLDNDNIDYRITFTTGKGFQVFPAIKPVKVLDEQIKVEMKTKAANIQLSLQSHLGLTSLDPKVIGRIRAVVRLPNTPYVNRHLKANGLYSIYVTKKEFQKGLDYLLKLAKSKKEMPPKLEPNISIDEFISLIPKFRIYKTYSEAPEDNIISSKTLRIPKLKNLGAKCLISELSNSNPAREVRFEATCWIKMMGYHDDSVIEFFSKLGWNNFSYKETRTQVSSIKPRRPSCSTLTNILGEKYCSNCPLREK